MSLYHKDLHQLQPDGYSYILYSEENNITYHKPFVSPLKLKSSQIIVKCRPTYIDYLLQNNITIKAANVDDFLAQFNTPKLKNFTPSILDSIVFHLHFFKGHISLDQLSKRYQYSNQKIKNDFKNSIGLSFNEYKNVLLSTT